jgi:hypothetical protein
MVVVEEDLVNAQYAACRPALPKHRPICLDALAMGTAATPRGNLERI